MANKKSNCNIARDDVDNSTYKVSEFRRYLIRFELPELNVVIVLRYNT